MLFVSSVRRSTEFYGQLGFAVESSFAPPGTREFSWVRLESGSVSLMLARAAAPASAVEHSAVFYLYCDDVPAFRDMLVSNGVQCGAIQHPFHSPGGEFRVTDPDGYPWMITHP